MTDKEIQRILRENSFGSAVESFMGMPDKSIYITRHVFETHLRAGVDAIDGVFAGSLLFLEWIQEAKTLNVCGVGWGVISLTVTDSWLSASEADLQKLRVPAPYLSVTLFKLPVDEELHLQKKPGSEDVALGVFENVAWSGELFNRECRKNLDQFDLWRYTPPKSHEFVEHYWVVYS